MSPDQFDAQLEALIQQARNAGLSADELIERLVSAVDRLENTLEED